MCAWVLVPKAGILHGGVALHLRPDAVSLRPEEPLLSVEACDLPVRNPGVRRLQLALNLLPYGLDRESKVCDAGLPPETSQGSPLGNMWQSSCFSSHT